MSHLLESLEGISGYATHGHSFLGLIRLTAARCVCEAPILVRGFVFSSQSPHLNSIKAKTPLSAELGLSPSYHGPSHPETTQV